MPKSTDSVRYLAYALALANLPPACLSVQDTRPQPETNGAQRAESFQNKPLAGAATCEPRECTPVRPTDPLIVDFTDVRYDGVFVDGDNFATRDPDWWQKFYGSPYVYPAGGQGLRQETAGAWHIQGNVAAWSGFGLWFGACTVDLSEYRGFSFDVSGNVGPSQKLKLFINTAPNEPPEACRPNVGSCDGKANDCKQPALSVPVAATPAKVIVLFEEATGGAPQASPDPAQILQLHFAFDWFEFQGQRHDPYVVDLTLDNFELVE